MTGIVVVYNTKEIFQRAYESIRQHLPALPLIIVDGSEVKNPCAEYVNSLRSPLNTVYQLGYNIGHGRGMHYGLTRCTTKTALLFDSDIVMLKNPITEMASLLGCFTYGVGWVYAIGRDGFDYGTPARGHITPIPYLHPYFMLLNMRQYFNFAPFVHHGAPCYKAMIDIFDRGLSKELVVPFSGLTGHTSGQGANWTGKPNEYIRHDFGGTRKANKMVGKNEIIGRWE
jgi:hypothetical protein